VDPATSRNFIFPIPPRKPINTKDKIPLPASIDTAPFHNSFVDELPGETATDTRPRQVPGVCYSRVCATPVADPHLLAWSDDFGTYLGLTRPDERGVAVDVLAGKATNPTMKPFAARYGGHQFGNWAGQLGDGRALSLGEITATDGSSWEIQLKGAGPTPYSRRADGRAVLRSSLREFVCSEAMYHLRVPTTRALSLVATGDTVIRDMFYNGDPRPEPGAIVARVAPSFIRFGNFEILTALGETENLKTLADYTIRHHFPLLGEPSSEVYLRWFEEICRRTAVLIAHWMSVGFVHGVLNTDNMSILGITIDYGPYGWLEPFDPDWTPNTTDFGMRRYAFGQQPRVGLWNLVKLAQALSPLITNPEDFTNSLERYQTTFGDTYDALMRHKLGMTSLSTEQDESDSLLIERLHQCLSDSEIDMTLFFRYLTDKAAALRTPSTNATDLIEALIEATSYAPESPANHASLRAWIGEYRERLHQENTDIEIVRTGMLRANPKYVLRNYLAQKAIEGAESGDLSFLNRLMTVLTKPFDEQPGNDDLAAKRPAWARDKPGCATLSCSS
jgi:uncharacterized protein YdiU (UPF0061 family)